MLVRTFGLRPDSGGAGKWRGGDGVVRELEMLEGMQVSILSERRTRQPYGLEGGENGKAGRNTWVKQPREEDGDVVEGKESEARLINIGGKATVWMGKGDVLRIETPGGGAWGAQEDGLDQGKQEHEHVKGWAARGSFAEREAQQAGF